MLLMVPLGGMFFLKGSLTASAFLLFLYVGSMYLTEIRPLQELGTNFANVLNAVTKAKEILDVPIYEGGTDFPNAMILNCGMYGFPTMTKPMCCKASISRSGTERGWPWWDSPAPQEHHNRTDLPLL